MDYKRKYEQAMLRMNKWVEGSEIIDPKEVAEFVFPELRESKDKGIIKEIISYLRGCYGAGSKDYLISKRKQWIAWLEKQGELSDKGEISDGFHTFNELYYYRMLYNAAFFNMLPKEWVHKSKKHHNSEECFGGGWFIVMANLPTGQVSNHYELKDWDLFQIPEKETADKWDGHTPQEAADRLHKYLLEKQGEQESEEKVDNPHNYYLYGEQKSSDKVEPKFKVGDCIRYRGENYNIEDIEITDNGFIYNVSIIGKASDPEEVKTAIGFRAEKDIIKIEQKPAWSEEDESIVNSILSYLKYFDYWDEKLKKKVRPKGVIKEMDWLKSLKERIKGE